MSHAFASKSPNWWKKISENEPTISEHSMKFGESDFGDLIASAEQLTADIDGGRAGDLPR